MARLNYPDNIPPNVLSLIVNDDFLANLPVDQISVVSGGTAHHVYRI